MTIPALPFTGAQLRAALVANERPADWLIVQSVDDLPNPVGDECILPAGKTVILAGDINIGSDAIRVSQGTTLRGLAGDTVISSNTSGVIRATNLDAALVMREFNVVATGGPCLALTGAATHQLNLFFMGLIGASAGVISGFEVQSVKQCYIEAADGFTFGGTTTKLFVEATPFYGITGSAIRLAAGFNARKADILTNFFKFNAPGNCIEAVAGYQLGNGRIRGGMIDGTANPLLGLDAGDNNWFMSNNDGIRTSRVAAQAFLTAPATTTIAAQGAFVPVLGNFELAAISERFTKNAQNELVYSGTDPVLATFNAAFTVDPSNNNRLAFKATKNGVALDQSQVFIEQGAGAGASPRPGATVALIALETGDRVGLSVANLSATANVPWLSATYAISA